MTIVLGIGIYAALVAFVSSSMLYYYKAYYRQQATQQLK